MRRLVALAAVLAIASLTDAAPSRDKPEERTFEEGMMLRFHMHENYGIARGLERLLLRGRLDDAKPLAAAIGEAPDAPGMGAFAKQSAEVRRRALDLSRAKTVGEAFRLEGKLLEACASCHVHLGVVPELASVPLPSDLDTIEARMARHLWAADRLWTGIVADSQEAWTNGLDVLASGSRIWPDLKADKAPLARQMQRTADTARRVKKSTIAARATTYGELLSTCASCHTAR
jgi:cytochrome c556